MNIERMTMLAEALEHPETLPVKFRMKWFAGKLFQDGSMGSYAVDHMEMILINPGYYTACIGGMACLLFASAEDSLIDMFQGPNHWLAMELLGLTSYQAELLFYNGWLPDSQYIANTDDLDEITTHRAARAVRRMIACPPVKPEDVVCWG